MQLLFADLLFIQVHYCMEFPFECFRSDDAEFADDLVNLFSLLNSFSDLNLTRHAGSRGRTG